MTTHHRLSILVNTRPNTAHAHILLQACAANAHFSHPLLVYCITALFPCLKYSLLMNILWTCLPTCSAGVRVCGTRAIGALTAEHPTPRGLPRSGLSGPVETRRFPLPRLAKLKAGPALENTRKSAEEVLQRDTGSQGIRYVGNTRSFHRRFH